MDDKKDDYVWKPDMTDLKFRDPLHTTEEEWKQLYEGERQGRNLMVTGGILLLFSLIPDILKGIGELLDDVSDWWERRKKKQ